MGAKQIGVHTWQPIDMAPAVATHEPIHGPIQAQPASGTIAACVKQHKEQQPAQVAGPLAIVWTKESNT